MKWRLWVAIGLVAMLAACGGSDDGPAVDAAAPGTATIGQSGGRVGLGDGAEVVVPPKALGADVKVSITKDSTGAPPLPPNTQSVGAVYAITPHGGNFSLHAEVSIPVERTAIAANEQLLLVTTQPGETQWTVLSGATYLNGKLRAPVTHFSFFRAIVLIDHFVPSLTTTINDGSLFQPASLPRTNNVGGPGINAISPDLQFDEANSGASGLGIFSAASMWSSMVLDARLTYTGPVSQTNNRFMNSASVRICRPVSVGHAGAQWRVLRNGAPTAMAGVGHYVVNQYDASSYPGNPGHQTRPFAVWEGAATTPMSLLDRRWKSGFGALHFYGDSVVPSRGDWMPAGSDDVWASPPAGNVVDDDTYMWHGHMPFTPADHNGRVQIETRVPTDCNLAVEAVPIVFRLNLRVDPSGQLANPAYRGVEPLDDIVAVGNGDTAVIPFVEVSADSSASIRWEFSSDPLNWQALAVPPERVQRGADGPGNFFGPNALGLERPYSIVINNAQLRDAGFFRAWACAKPAGTFCFSNAPIQLAVHTAPPSIVLQPLPQTVTVGQTATFAARGAPSGPVGFARTAVSVPTVQWQRRSVVEAAFNIGGWTNIAGATDADANNPWRTSYTTPATTAADHGYLYRALFTTSVGTTATEPAVLVVVAPQAAQAPIVTGQPASQNAVAGSTATFVVTVTGTQPMNYQWRKNGASIPGANSTTLTLPNVSAQDDANYDIAITNQAGTVTSNAARLTVTPAPGQPLPPQILASPASISVAAGNAANFAVAVSGAGPFTYQWLKNGVAVPGGTSAAFTISPVALADAGSYAVRVTNAVASVTSNAASLTVTAAPTPVLSPPTIAMAPISLAVPPGAGATLAVAVTGTAPFTYQWLRNGEPVAGAAGPMLHFGAVTAVDAGQYTVAITNAAGSASSPPAQLIVSGAPVISAQPLSATAAEGTSATFSVTASGDALRYQWLLNGVAINGATATSYTTPSLSLADSGARFSVIVFNAAGIATSISATLMVTAPPPVPSWSIPQAVATTGDNGAPAAGIDGARNTLTVWSNYQGSRGRITAARGSVAGPWEAGIQIDAALPANADSYDPQLAVAPNGTAISVWGYGLRGTVEFHVAAARFSGGGWGAAERLDTEFNGQSSGFRVGIDSTGRAIAIWRQFNGTRRAIYARLHDGGTWSMPQLIDGGSNSGDPELAVDTQGRGWVVMIGPGQVKAAAVDVAAGTIGAPVVVAAGRSMANARVGLDATGGAVIAWIEDMVTGGYDLRASRFAGSAWTAVETLAVNVPFNQEIAAAAGASGQAVVTWIGRPPGSSTDAVFARALAGGTWAAAVRVSADGGQRPQAVQVVMNGAGRAVLHWSDQLAGGTPQAWARVYDSTWGPAEAVQTAPESMQPQFVPVAVRSVAIADDGAAVLLWTEGSRGIGLRASYYR